MNGNDSRQKILNAALDEFSEKGYDGSRVEDIAQRAGISKALIYYNFDSKEMILNEILDGIVQSLVEHLSKIYLSGTEEKKSKPVTEEEFIASLNYILDKRKEMTLLIMQSLGARSKQKRILNIWNEINLKLRSSILTERGYRSERFEETTQRLIDYFLIFIPYIMYAVLGSDWIQDNEISTSQANSALSKVFINIYDWYWK
ncbi:MAG: TetR/AcrR family transcriptional regulator [Anaerolineaceae bacterium]|nr:TetR/AcrR family transcriptional regulator [Anaerolineaceae bacterium]